MVTYQHHYSLAFAVALLFASQGIVVPGNAQTKRQEGKIVNLTAKWKTTEESLEVQYELENRSEFRVLALTYLFHVERSGVRKIDRNLAFVSVDRDGNVLLEKLAPVVPDDIDVESPYIPYAELLEPGEKTKGRAIVPLPLKPHKPYVKSTPMFAFTRTKTAQLRIGFITFNGEEIPGKVIDEIDGISVYSIRSNVVSDKQKIVTTQSIDLELPIFRKPVEESPSAK